MKKAQTRVQDLQGRIAGAVKELTPEQKKEQLQRFVNQKLEAWTTGIVFNAVQGKHDLTPEQGREIVHTAVETAYAMLDALHGIRRSEPSVEA